MTNTSLLAAKVSESGITKTALARKVGVSRESFYKKANGKTEFTATEIMKLADALRLTLEEKEEIFFAM